MPDVVLLMGFPLGHRGRSDGKERIVSLRYKLISDTLRPQNSVQPWLRMDTETSRKQGNLAFSSSKYSL